MSIDSASTLDDLRHEAASCRACPLWKGATQTVFGEGPADAEIMFVGEQPGDREDLAGRPFVGPAGRIFDHALTQAGLDRSRIYVTNAVKHFKFEPRGKRRLHKRPNAGEISACKRWLLGEIEAVRPQLVVALGATAAQSLAGRPVGVQANRGVILHPQSGMRIFVTVHPSSLLRLRDETEKKAAFDRFVTDLRSIEQSGQISTARAAREADKPAPEGTVEPIAGGAKSSRTYRRRRQSAPNLKNGSIS